MRLSSPRLNLPSAVTPILVVSSSILDALIVNPSSGCSLSRILFKFVIARAFYPGLLYVSIKFSISYHPSRMLDARGHIIGYPSSMPMRCTFRITNTKDLFGLANGCHILRLRVSMNSSSLRL